MLESKYLTQDGIQLFLGIIHKRGFNYLFLDTNADTYVASSEKPGFVENVFMFCGGRQSMIVGEFATTVVKDLLENRNYIEIEDYVDCTDWSKVAVDTPILVKLDNDGDWYRRYFAKYEDGIVYVWGCGATEWTNEGCDPIAYAKAKLAE